MAFKSGFGVPRTTHQWLAPLYNYLDKGVAVNYPSGASGIPNAAWLGKSVPQAYVGNATGVVGFFGFSGLPFIATGGQFTGGGATFAQFSGITATGIGGSGLFSALQQFGWNGGTGTMWTLNDVVKQLKNIGILAQ